MPKHTPGNWTLDEKNYDRSTCTVPVFTESSDEDGPWMRGICNVHLTPRLPRNPGNSALRAEQLANARLIAAAPELLQVVKELAALFRLQNHGGFSHAVNPQEKLPELEALVAKIES